MKRTAHNARLAVGAALVAVAGLAAAGSLSAAPDSAPPSTTPDSSPTLDSDREDLIAEIVDSAGDAGLPLDRDCVAALIVQVPDEDIAIISQEIAAETESEIAISSSLPEDAVGSVPLDTTSGEIVVAETIADDIVPASSQPGVTPLTEELGLQLVTCARGDADPALVDQALSVIQADPDAPSFDMECVASVLTTLSDETLTLIIEDDDLAPTETAAAAEVSVDTLVPLTIGSEPAPAPASTEAFATADTGVAESPETSFPDDALAEAFSLLICAPDLLGELDSMGDVAVSSASAPEPAVVGDTTGAEPTQTTTG